MNTTAPKPMTTALQRCRPTPLAQHQRGQQGDEQRRCHVHHRRFGQRDAAERDVIGGKRKEREHPADKHQPRPPRAQNPRALPGQRHHEQQREHDREPNHQNLDHRITLGQQLDDRILRRKRKQREHAVEDAGYGAMGRVDREVCQGVKQGSLRGAGEFTIVVSEALGASGLRRANPAVKPEAVFRFPNNRPLD